ncbi:MAG: 3',5'-cyclic-nucleotide phosphodiesterase [Pyrinomonadaceae bacterium]
MKLQLLPSTFEENGTASAGQHLTCFLIDDAVAFDAGSLAMASTPLQKERIRDIVISHAHLDHIAGLPLFIDDLFATLSEPIRVFAAAEVIDTLERDIFNWRVYPRFSELSNQGLPVLEYREIESGCRFEVAHLSALPIGVNHKVPSSGFIVSDGSTTIALTGDTAATGEFWETVNNEKAVAAVLIECAFPNELSDLAAISHHLTPDGLEKELAKLKRSDCEVYVVNIKPAYRNETIKQVGAIGFPNLSILDVGRVYEW